MPLHCTGKTLTLGGANAIDLLANNKMAWRECRADLQNRILRDAEFCQL